MHTEPTIDASNDAEAWRSQSVRAQRPLRDELLDLANLEFRVVRSGAAAKRLKINSHRCTLGSGEGCTVRLNDPSLRAMHAVILRDASRVLLRAYTVPIEVNGALVNEQFLQLGDTFRLGSYLFELVDGPQLIEQELRSSQMDDVLPTPELSSEWDELATREFPLRNRPTPISVDETDRPLTSAAKPTPSSRPRLSFAGGTRSSFVEDSDAVSDLNSLTSQTQITQRAVQRHESDALRREIDAWRRREAQWQQDQIQIRSELATAISRFNESQTQAQQATDAVSQMRVRLNEITHEFQTLSRQYEISLTENAQQQASMRSSITKLERDREQVEEARKRVEDKLRQEIVARQQAEEKTRDIEQSLEQSEASRSQVTFEKDRAIADAMRLANERDAAKKENSTLQDSVAQSSRRIEALAKELETTSHRLADARREVTDAYEKVSTLTAQIKKLEQQARASEQVTTSQSQALAEAQRRSSLLVDQLAELTANREQERSSWELEAKQLQQTVEQLSLELASTAGQLATTSDEHEATRSELNAAYERLTATRRELAEASKRPTVEEVDALKEQLASIPTNTEAQLEPLRVQLEEALQRPTAEQWQDVQQRLAASERQLEEARVAVNELQQQAEQQRLLVRTEEPTAGRTQAWSAPSLNAPQAADPTTSSWSLPSSAAAGAAYLQSASTTSAFIQTPAQPSTFDTPNNIDDAAKRTASAALQSPAQFTSSLPTAVEPTNADPSDDAVDGNAYDWPTYQLESEPQVEAEPPVRTPTAESATIDWANRLAMLRRDVLESAANDDESDEIEPAAPASAWGWSPVSPSSESLDEVAQGTDSEVVTGLDEDDSVAARLQNFTSRDQRIHQPLPASHPWGQTSELDSQKDTPTVAPETTEVASRSWWKSSDDDQQASDDSVSSWRRAIEEVGAQDSVDEPKSEIKDKLTASESVDEPTSDDESLGALAKQLIAQLSQQNDSESKAASYEDDSMSDDLDASRSIGSWMAASPLWGQAEEPEIAKEPQSVDDSWSAAALLRREQASHDAHAVTQNDEDSDEDHGGTMMMPDWPSKSSLKTPEIANRYQQSERTAAEDVQPVEPTRQFEFQAQRYAVEEAEPAEPVRETPVASTRSSSRTSDTDDEDSIEDYMNRLLQRVQGTTVTSGVTTPTSAATPTDASGVNRYSNYTNSGVRNASTVTSSIDVMDPNAPIIPRSQAPEDANNLAAMRELANASAKSAITKSVRGQANQLKSRAIMDLMQAGIVLVCGFAFYIAGLRLSHLRLVWFTAASLAVALSFFFVYDMFRKLAAARRSYVAANRGEQSED